MQIRCYCSPSVQVLDLTTSCDDNDDECYECDYEEDDRWQKLNGDEIYKWN